MRSALPRFIVSAHVTDSPVKPNKVFDDWFNVAELGPTLQGSPADDQPTTSPEQLAGRELASGAQVGPIRYDAVQPEEAGAFFRRTTGTRSSMSVLISRWTFQKTTDG